MKFQVFMHLGRTSGTPGAVVTGPAGAVEVLAASHLEQTVEVMVTGMVEVVIPVSILVVPAVT